MSGMGPSQACSQIPAFERDNLEDCFCMEGGAVTNGTPSEERAGAAQRTVAVTETACSFESCLPG